MTVVRKESAYEQSLDWMRAQISDGAWTVGNTKLQLVLTSEDPQKNELLQSYADDAIATASLGFRFVK
ncbi:MAG: hypothetical protein ABS976_02300, partial [Rhodococcus sp. (in: high G+C Gram-positive bacteria)]